MVIGFGPNIHLMVRLPNSENMRVVLDAMAQGHKMILSLCMSLIKNCRPLSNCISSL
jgi:hypothetical protein